MPTIESARADILRVLKSAEIITVISHYNPDSDAYGSSLGLAAALRSAGGSVITVNQTGVSEKYRSIPGVDTILATLPPRIGLLVVCDCGSFNRVSDAFLPILSKIPLIINIDHHISNDNFGHINLVDTNASSTSEMIYDLLIEGGYTINDEIATCLLAGIIGDTGSFRYSSTTAKTLRIAAALVDSGASPTNIFKSLYGSSPLGAVKLQSECMLNLEISFNGQFAEVIVPSELLSKHGATLEDTEGLVERARDIEGVKISASIREDGPLWRISLRSSSESYNVSEIASHFGGGGHVQAAAFRSSKALDVIRNLLSERVKGALE